MIRHPSNNLISVDPPLTGGGCWTLPPDTQGGITGTLRLQHAWQFLDSAHKKTNTD